MRSDMGLAPTASEQQHSPWHSPVPYLFGGLAAMLGLIAFALLILACSYWKLSGYLEGGEGNDDIESGDGKPKEAVAQKAATVYEEKIFVIMAGDQKPTCLATPRSSRVSSFNDNNKSKSDETGSSCDDVEKSEKRSGGGSGCDGEQTQVGNSTEELHENQS